MTRGELRLQGPETLFGARAVLRRLWPYLRRCGLRLGGAATIFSLVPRHKGAGERVGGMVTVDGDTLRPWRTPGVATVLLPLGATEDSGRWWVLSLDARGRVLRHTVALTRRGMEART